MEEAMVLRGGRGCGGESGVAGEIKERTKKGDDVRTKMRRER